MPVDESTEAVTSGNVGQAQRTSGENSTDTKAPVAAIGSFSGTAISVVLHLWLIATCASITLASRDTTPVAPVETRFTPVDPIEEPEQILEYELANPRDEEFEVRKVVNARSIGSSQAISTPKAAPVPPPLIDVPLPQFRPAEIYDVSEGEELDDRVNLKGRSGEEVVQIESALDRITWEIASHLQERKVLVVWLLDASVSVEPQRKAIARRLNRVYGELGLLQDAGELIPRSEKGLLTGVVTFGEKLNFLTSEPTDQPKQVLEAFEQVPTDPAGVENVFGAVEQVVKRWSKYRTQFGRSILVMVVTDEAGSDFSQHLETSIAASKKNGAKVYCVGPAALFGRKQGFVPYVAPEDGKTYQLPVEMGPETPMMEYVSLPFWFNGPQYDNLSAGIGPYALSRLVKETGGVYFLSNMTTTAALSPLGVFPMDGMRPYEPDYRFGKFEDYERDLNKHPLRRSVVQAAALSLRYKAQGTPNLDLRVTPTNYLPTINDSQKTAAETTLMVDTILQPFAMGGKLEEEYQKETSLRWKAAYNLTYGRLLAIKVRAFEYNYACAQLKLLGTGDVATKSNHWIFQPDAQLGSGASMKKLATESDRLLKRCVNEAPGTPWSLLASRELMYPLGMKVQQKFIQPPTPREIAAAAAAKTARFAPEMQKKTPPKKPEPPPKPPALPKL
jgi:hypothetical protein